MVAQVRPRTYSKYVSDVTPIADMALITGINPSFLVHFIGVRWYSDAAGTTEVSPSAGSVTIECFDDTSGRWKEASDSPIQNDDPSLKAYYPSNISDVRATTAGVVGAAYYRIVVNSHDTGSTVDGLLLDSIETSKRGNTALGVFVQDQTTAPLAVLFLETLNETTIAVDTVVDTYTFTASPGHGIVVGNIVEIADAVSFEQARVLAVAGDVITIDTPINRVYVAGSPLVVSSRDLRVDGSVTPRVFSVLPNPNQAGDFVRMIVAIQSTQAMDFSGFGSLPKLTRGCVLRVNNGDGTYNILFNWKSNGELIARGFDHSFQTKVGGGLHSFVSQVEYGGQADHGTVIRLDGRLNESLELIVQDDLSVGLDEFAVLLQGHEVQEEV